MKTTEAEKAVNYVLDSYTTLVKSEKTIFHAETLMLHSQLYTGFTSLQGEPLYDVQDRPLTLALKS